MMGATTEPDEPTPLWERVVTDTLDTLPQVSSSLQVRHRATLVCADTMAAIYAARNQPELVALARQASVGPAVIVTDGFPRADAQTAAFVNATAGTWLELDEAAHTGVHAAIHVLAPTLAMAQQGACSGRELLGAFLAGYEVTAALYNVFVPRYPTHPHAGAATVGAAVGVALVTGQDPLAVARIASAAPVASTWDACFEGATVRHTFAGHAASAAVRASQLAAAGFTGSRRTADTWFGSVIGDTTQPVADPAGAHIMLNSFKFHSACLTCHAAIDAALELGTVPTTAEVVVETVPDVAEKVARLPADNPLSTKFSLQYAVATALLRGRSDPPAFEFDPDVAAFARRISVRSVTDLPCPPHGMPARVMVRHDGAQRVREITFPRGHHTHSTSVADLRDKAKRMSGSTGVFDEFMVLGSVADCATLMTGSPSKGHTAHLGG